MNGALLNMFRQGGYILYSRHGEATVGEDQRNLSFRDCQTQRNLSMYGRRQAIYYGKLLRTLRIPISYPVISSPFCRAIETAQLAFGRENISVDPFWYDVYRLSGDIPTFEQYAILDDLTYEFETLPPSGRNTVIIAHSFPREVGLGQIPDMGTVIIRPNGRGGGYEIIGRLSLKELGGISLMVKRFSFV